MPNINYHNQTSPIGFFDSGIGGVTIWKAVHRLLPNENTVYLADNRNAPYGEKTNDEIIALSEKNTEFLLQQNVKLIVVACNTASTVAIPYLRQKYRVPFIRIQPAIKPAGIQSKTKKIGLLATQRTLQSAMLQELKENIPTQDVDIIGTYGAGLVELVEAQKNDTPEAYQLLEKYLKPMLQQNVDQLVLGCTHYPFLISQMKKIVGDKINIIEPSMAIAKQVKRVLEQASILSTRTQAAHHYFYANQHTESLQQVLSDYKHISIVKEDF